MKHSQKAIVFLSLLTLLSSAVHAEEVKTQDEIVWKGLTSAPSYHIRVVGPDGFVYENVFKGQMPSITSLALGNDGLYKYEITPNMELPDEIKSQMKSSGERNNMAQSAQILQQVTQTKSAEIVSGNFRVMGGVILGDEVEGGAK